MTSSCTTTSSYTQDFRRVLHHQHKLSPRSIFTWSSSTLSRTTKTYRRCDLRSPPSPMKKSRRHHLRQKPAAVVIFDRRCRLRQKLAAVVIFDRRRRRIAAAADDDKNPPPSPPDRFRRHPCWLYRGGIDGDRGQSCEGLGLARLCSSAWTWTGVASVHHLTAFLACLLEEIGNSEWEHNWIWVQTTRAMSFRCVTVARFH
jgi:hypothetical protein